jgi:hypothetical protein
MLRLVRYRWSKLGPVLAVMATAAGACIASAPSGIHRQTDDGSGGGIDVPDGGGPDALLDAGNGDPHAVLGADPPHGPFTGGQRVLVQGKGFGSDVRVWFGPNEVDSATLVAIDATRIQVETPPGQGGAVELVAQNGDDESTRRALAGGYVYDRLYAAPDEGPVSGGTTIEIIGQGTSWDETSVAKIDQQPCTTLVVESPTLLSCTVPQGTPGSKPVSVATGEETLVVLDGYTYEDSDNGYKGGLSGDPIAGSIKVLAYDNFTGDPIPGAHALVGSSLDTALQASTDSYGVAVFDDPSLDGPRTVTVAAECHSPISFVDVTVDTVTVYLDPVLLPECAGDGDPPPVGGKPGASGLVFGELVWGMQNEFEKGDWSNVPVPQEGERQVAYVWVAGNDPGAEFQIPSGSLPVTPLSPGEYGYEFVIGAAAGNRALYALAGLEDQSFQPPRFTAYVMGILKGVPITPDVTVDDVYIPMVRTLDQALVWEVESPAPGPKGPDRLRGSVAIMLGNDGFGILPSAKKTPLLPLSGPLSFIGVPALDGDFLGSSYLSTARAVTGPGGSAPLSVIGRILSQTTSQPVDVSGFVGVPTLVTPALNGAWDGRHLATDFPPGLIDVSVYDIASGNGLWHWTVVVPAGSHAVEVPDLSGFELAGLPPGPVLIGVYGGRVEGFDYGDLRYRDIRPVGMSAYSLDYFPAHL